MSDRTLRILAMTLAIGAVVLAYLGLQLAAPPPPPTQENRQTSDPRYSVVIAKRPITAGHAIDQGDLETIRVPARQQDSFNDAKRLVTRRPVTEIAAGEIILESHFQPGSPMARLLKAGERAVAINVTEVIGGGGYLQPGDYVDVLLYLRGGNTEVKRSMARTLIKHVQVLAYGGSMAGGGTNPISISDSIKRAGNGGRSAVLAVPSGEVERLMLAENAGIIRLALVSSQEVENGGSSSPGKSVGISALTSGQRPTGKGPSIPVYRGGQRTLDPIVR